MANPTKAETASRTSFLGTMTPEEVCRELNIKQRTLWDWCQRKQFPHLRLGGGERGRLIFDVKDVRAWLAAQSKVTAREAIEEKGDE